MEKLGPDAMLILWSAPSQRYSLDIDYEYRQDSNLYYLTGLTQENTILVLMPGNKTQRELLFVKDRNPAREHWTGTLLTLEQAKSQTGVDRVFRASQFDEFIAGCPEPAAGWRRRGSDRRVAILRGAVGRPRARRARARSGRP